MTKHKLLTIDATRGIAALCVMLFHFTNRHAELHQMIQPFPNAYIAVDYFLCLSGFVIAYSYEDKLIKGMQVSDFVWRRIVRLYPMYIVGTLLGLAASIGYSIFDKDNSWRSITIVFLFAICFLPYLRSFSARSDDLVISDFVFPLNLPSWSLFFELSTNLIYGVAKICGRWLALALTVSFGYIVMTTFAWSPSGWNITNFIGGFPRAFFSFFIGTLLFEFWRTQTWNHLNLGPVAPCIFVAAMCAAPYHNLSFLFMVLIVGPLTVWLATCNPCSAILSRIYVFLGEISYPIYAIHLPAYNLVQFAYDKTTGSPVSALMPPWLVIFVAVFVILLSFLLLRVFDLPVRSWLLSLKS